MLYYPSSSLPNHKNNFLGTGEDPYPYFYSPSPSSIRPNFLLAFVSLEMSLYPSKSISWRVCLLFGIFGGGGWTSFIVHLLEFGALMLGATYFLQHSKRQAFFFSSVRGGRGSSGVGEIFVCLFGEQPLEWGWVGWGGAMEVSSGEVTCDML